MLEEDAQKIRVQNDIIRFASTAWTMLVASEPVHIQISRVAHTSLWLTLSIGWFHEISHGYLSTLAKTQSNKIPSELEQILPVGKLKSCQNIWQVSKTIRWQSIYLEIQESFAQTWRTYFTKSRPSCSTSPKRGGPRGAGLLLEGKPVKMFLNISKIFKILKKNSFAP